MGILLHLLMYTVTILVTTFFIFMLYYIDKEVKNRTEIHKLIKYRCLCMSEYINENINEILLGLTRDEIIDMIHNDSMGISTREHFLAIVNDETIADRFEGVWKIAAKAVDIDNIGIFEMQNNTKKLKNWKG